jgi:hypothetical protein
MHVTNEYSPLCILITFQSFTQGQLVQPFKRAPAAPYLHVTCFTAHVQTASYGAAMAVLQWLGANASGLTMQAPSNGVHGSSDNMPSMPSGVWARPGVMRVQ